MSSSPAASSRPITTPLLAVAALAAALSGCTWVRMAPGASEVRVVTEPPAGCTRRGEVEVSVVDRVPFYERNRLRVREELETMARNEAPGLGADTIHAQDGPEDGEQRWVAWRCRG